MITLSTFQNYKVVETTSHRRRIPNGDEYELKLKGVSTPLLVKIQKDTAGKYVPTQSYDIYQHGVGPYSSSNPKDTEDEAMDEIVLNSLSMYIIGSPFHMDDNPDY